METLSKHWRRRGGRQPEVKFSALELITVECCPRPPRVAAERKVGFTASRDGHFFSEFAVPKIRGNFSIIINSKKCFLTLIFVFYVQIFDIFFCFTAKITLHIESVIEEERRQAKSAVKERKAKEMGEFPGIRIVPSDVYVL